jgi:hypothetical protein
MREIHLRIGSWQPKPGSGWALAHRLVRLNARDITIMVCLSVVSAFLFYTPAMFLRKFIAYLEVDKARENTGWGGFYVVGLFAANVVTYLGMWIHGFFPRTLFNDIVQFLGNCGRCQRPQSRFRSSFS